MGLSGASELKELMRSKSESNEFYFTAQEAKEMGAADFIGSIKLQPTVGFNVMVIPPEVEKTPEEELEENSRYLPNLPYHSDVRKHPAHLLS